MIRIVYGKAKCGKTHQIYSEIHAAAYDVAQKGKKGLLYLIVPEQYTLEAEKQLIDHGQSDGFIGIEVVSFKRLAHKVFSEVGQPEGVRISEIGKIMMLRRLFSTSKGALTVYQSAYNKFGFLSKFHDLIKEFKQNMVSPESLDQMIGFVEDGTLLKNKLKDFSVVFKAYENEKAKDFFDDEDFYITLLESLPQSQNLKHATIWVDGFDSFTVQELQILSTLSTLATTLSITICTNGVIQAGHFEHTNTLFKRLSEMAMENRISLTTELCERPFPSQDIMHVAENLLAYPYTKKAIDQEAVQIFVADNRLDEVEYCAAKIVDLVRDKGYDWQDFAVVTNDLDAYAMSIKRIFDEFELPYFLDQKRQVANNPLVHLIKSYLHMYSEGFSTEQMVNFLKTGLVISDAQAISRFEIYAKQYGVREKKLMRPFEIEGKDLELENAVRETLASLIVPEFKSKLTVRMAIEKLFELLIKLEINEKIDAQVKAFATAGNYDEAQQFAQIWNKTMDLFDQLVEIMGDEVLSIDALIEVVESGFETTEVGLLPLSDSQILVGSIDRSRAHPIKVLFFLGLNDGIVPELGNDKQLILDSEKAFFSEKGIKLLADSQMFVSKEQFNLYFAMTRPTEKLYFSYSRSDSEGRALRPSYFINKLSRICSNIKTVDARVSQDWVPYRVSTSKGTVKHMATEMRRAVDGYPISPVWETTFAWYAENEYQTAKLLMNGLTHTNIAEKLSRKSVLAAYELPIKTSVSRLERYVECPFKYFVESGLRPIPQKSYELGAPDVGILFHSALEHFGKTIFKENIEWQTLTKDRSDAMMETIIDTITDVDIYHSRFQYQYMINKLKRVSKKAAWTLTQQLSSGAFVPTAFEVAFGDGPESVAPILVSLTNGERLLIRGVIDRVDTVEIEGKKYVKIIDYKSGRKSLSLSDIYNGLQMQLMVYLSACMDNPHYFKANEIAPAGAFYFRIDDPFIEATTQVETIVHDKIASELKLDGISLEDVNVLKHLDADLFDHNVSNVIQVKIKADGAFSKDSKIMPIEAFEGMIKHVENKIRTIGDELLEGKIDVSPCMTDGFVSCQYCDFKALCQFDRHFEGNTYRRIKSFSNEEVIEKLKG